MRIGINALQLTARNSGIGQYIYNMISSLISLNINEYYLYLSRGNARPEWLGQRGVDIKEIPFCKEQVILRNLYELFYLGQDLSRDDLSVYWSPDTKIPLLIPKNIPFVVTVHDLAIIKEPETYKYSRVVYWRRLFQHAIQKSSYVVAISQTTRNDLIELMDVSPEKIKVVYNGVSAQFKPVENTNILMRVAKKYCLPEKFLLFVGLFSPRKNIAGILRAFSILKNEYQIPHRLVMVGEKGWRYRADLELVQSFGLEKQVFFPGFVEDEDLPAVYNLADVFVFPSLYEGFGLPVLEAMACGIPVVTSNISALPEVVGKAGILVNPHEPEEIATGIHRLISNKKLSSELAKAGLKRSRHFLWENAARELLKVFREIA
ncbi:glycosyltransferase family 4 protein [Pelotomaculum terephthalicicum JT]|uniref:glycosyltransferase family 4 protein n=1 Tax=Pelotomaculum terephthalicicum TaxID=206393 RepID=UPI001F038665|nr:glycosyltransferase family 1 protein [Pelotomaculum terephthalicicum]MCG9966624.1 glycosyltransferase family 4 protein [Pelotomaculum terephthalicicum JT]